MTCILCCFISLNRGHLSGNMNTRLVVVQFLEICLCLVLKVRIGAMLAYTPLDEKSLALLLSYLQDFLK